MIKDILHIFSFFALFFLISCSTIQNNYVSELYQQKYSAPPPKPMKDAYYRIKHPLQCVPYAREMSGIQIRGNAHTWWGKATNKYQRGSRPRVGSVMVLSKTSRLNYGHLAVVKRIIDSRNIEVTHANWGGDRYTRSYVYRRMPVVDTSPNNDWSQARFWNYPSSSYGSVYRVSGFIYPNADTKPSLVSTLAPQKNKTIPKPAGPKPYRAVASVSPTPSLVKPVPIITRSSSMVVPKPEMKPIY